MSKAKLQAAKELLDSKQYTAARTLLETMPEESTAQKWLAKLEQIAPSPSSALHSTRRGGRLIVIIGMLVAALGGFFVGREAMRQEIAAAFANIFSGVETSVPTEFELTSAAIVETNQAVETLVSERTAQSLLEPTDSMTSVATETPLPTATITETTTPTVTLTATNTETATVTPAPLIFSGNEATVIGPVEIPAGIYRATATTGGFIIVSVTATAGECGAGTGFLSPGLFNQSAGQATNGAEAIFTSEGCTALFEVSNVQQSWTLELVKVG
jgi:hypothetical protein